MDIRTHLAGFRSALGQRKRFDPAIPLVAGQPLIGSLAHFRKDAFGTLRAAGDQGDLVRVDFAYRRTVLTKHPDAISALLESPDDWERTTGLAPLLGKNVLTTIGDEWSANRSMAQPSFHQRIVAAAATEFARESGALLDAWPARAKNGVVDVAQEAMRTFALLAPRAFGLSMTPAEAQLFPAVVQRLQHWGFLVVAGGAPRTKQVEEDLSFLYTIIDRALDTPPPPNAPPSFLERLRQDRQIERSALRGHLILMLIASADNPPNTLAFTIWLLTQHPTYADLLRAELAGAGEPSAEELDALPLLDQVLSESMRLYPPVWFLARNARRDTELLGRSIPEGTMAFVSTWHAHRHPAYWERPEEFDPSRFASEQVEKRHRYIYVPFGMGQRRCIGSRIARLEMKVVLSQLLRRFRITPGAAELPLEGTFALRARGGVPVRLEKLG